MAVVASLLVFQPVLHLPPLPTPSSPRSACHPRMDCFRRTSLKVQGATRMNFRFSSGYTLTPPKMGQARTRRVYTSQILSQTDHDNTSKQACHSPRHLRAITSPAIPTPPHGHSVNVNEASGEQEYRSGCTGSKFPWPPWIPGQSPSEVVTAKSLPTGLLPSMYTS